MAAVLLYFASAAFVLDGLLLHYVSAENHMCAAACSCLLNLVDCSKLGLIEVPKDLPVFVTRLELQGNGISSITAEDFRGLNNLTQLDISSNEIRVLNASVFKYLPALKQLKINFNKLTEVPQFKGLWSVTTLEFNHNRIQTLAMEMTKEMPQLKVLELNHNQIIDIIPGIFPVHNTLQKLTLNGNGLETFEPGCFDNLTSLEVLKMNKNRIRILPMNLFSKMEKLKTLELMKNQLCQIEGLSFQNLSNLQVLKLRKNQISVLSDAAFFGLYKIQSLQLDHNNITTVTQRWLYRMTSLRQLTLTNNKIHAIDSESLKECERLQLLDLSNNQLTSITRWSFSGLHHLLSLYLSNNQISNIEDGAFRDLGQLELLELNNNAISWTIEDMNGAFTGLTALTKLELENNKIKSIAQNAFRGLGQVSVLSLQNNAITSIQRNALESMSKLTQLSFNSSSLLCDCQLSWLPDWLELKSFQNTVTAVCAHPLKLRGRNIYTIDPQQFKCEGNFLQPVITVSPPLSQIALKGQNVTLKCSANSTMQSHTQFSWKKNNMLLMDKSVENFVRADGEIYNYTSLLHLNRVQDSDTGVYQCIISNEFGSAYSNKSDIRVHVFPKFVKTPIDVTVKAGNTARLQCAATGQPTPIIKWNKDKDFPAARERRVHVMPEDDVFFIVEVERQDEGVYTCIAKNDAGMISANATLRVLESPTFVKPMENIKVTPMGETAVLECMAAGSPPPSLTWLKNGQPLKESQRYFFTASNQLLIIVETERSDHGRYTCVMSNTLGKETGYTLLRVIPKNRGVITEQKSPSTNTGPSDESTTTGIIIIAVVCCVVGTSLVWVIIIYQTRKRHEMYSATPTDETTLPGEVPSSGYTSSDKEGSFTQPVPMTAPNYQYHDYQMKESGYESSSGRFRAARAAIFPSDVDEEDHQQSVPLTLGEHQLGSESPENSVSSLHYPNSDETDSLKSSHSTNSTRASDHHTLRTFHPLPTGHDTLSSRTSANSQEGVSGGGGHCEGCDQCHGTASSERQNCRSANYRHSLYNSAQQNGMPIHHGSQPQPPGAAHTSIDYQVENTVCDSQHTGCSCHCGVTAPVHNSPGPVPSNSTVCHRVIKSPSPTHQHVASGMPPHVVPNIPNPYNQHGPSSLNTHDCHACANNNVSCSVAPDSNPHYKQVLVVGGAHRKSNGAVDKIPPVIPPKHRHSSSSSHSKANGVVQNGKLKSSNGKTVDV